MPTPRVPLNRSRVLADAVALADGEGADAVSMRRLADRLGVVPMALYKHVGGKDDLVDGMVDAVLGEVVAARPADGDWRAAVRATLLSARAAVQRHPWARRAIETRTVRTPAVLGHMEAVTRLLLDAGFTPDLAHHAMHALGNRIWGFSPELFDEDARGAPRARTTPQPNPADYPSIIAVSVEARRRRPDATGCDEDFEFTFALDLLLDALDRLRSDGWESPVSG
ncbi:TetR/AcrR family transcriptional regulator [Phycicoccus sp. HDW14]|uniref:TetR/AcrR family transcriptional regulator n=1 Tax=Phycicoccus sp. HDW14 TaxID=2714941 RepID=UPI00140C6A24|nr:TetR/AcrR family transcriptional regulator [Phycicoccus sp. HDW14]QIM22477.1 TetR/AcrR family transcriptional regulator [Phycicoccus sp. HDW14]